MADRGTIGTLLVASRLIEVGQAPCSEGKRGDLSARFVRAAKAQAAEPVPA